MTDKLLAVACLAMTGLTGCQCFPATENYQNAVDRVADHQPHLDHWYCAGLDLTRIGYPDWCQHSWNRILLDPQQCRGSRALPEYAHNPIYIQPREAPEPRPIPIPPASEPAELEAVDPAMQAPPREQIQPIRDPALLDEGTKRPVLESSPPPVLGPGAEIPLPPDRPQGTSATD